MSAVIMYPLSQSSGVQERFQRYSLSVGARAYVSLALYLPVGPAAKLAARGIEGASVSRPALVVPQGPGLALAHA